MALKCIIFDFDDTLVHTINLHTWCWTQAINKIKGTNVSEDFIKEKINYGIDLVFTHLGMSHSEREAAKLLKTQLFTKNLESTQPSFLVSCLDLFLVKYKVIATNASRENVELLLNHHNIDASKFNLIVTRDDVEFRKPAPDMGVLILDKLKIKPNECAMIGDSDVDLIFSKNVGIENCIIL